jgi:prolyl-tRNA editing enzyme YbaK/EbsC (Cys-tRNA(Pro) deacylase)
MVYPAAGSLNTSVAVPPDRLAQITAGKWVDICRLPE